MLEYQNIYIEVYSYYFLELSYLRQQIALLEQFNC